MSGPVATGTSRAGVDAQYVVLALDATLPNERVLTAGAGITLVDGGAGGAATLSVQNLYLRLDATNDPVTAGLEINAATADEPVLILQTTDDDATNPILEIQNSGGVMLSEVEKDGNLNFATATAANPGILEINSIRFFHTYGTGNVFFGVTSGNFTLTGQQNIGIGLRTFEDLISGSFNMAIGAMSLRENTTGNSNVAIGQGALKNNLGGSENVAIGGSVLEANLGGNANLGVGASALKVNTTGSSNVAIGKQALDRNISGSANVAIGAFSLHNVVAANFNVAIGQSALEDATSEHGVVVGFEAGANITTGARNICLGYRAGNVLTTGGSNIIIGYDIDPTGVAVSSELNIGALIYGDLSAKIAGINVTPPSLAAAWHVDQATSDAAIPVLLLDQADVSEEMIEFVSTIGVGNAIEAVGVKALTTTHFIKVTLPGGLTRYFPVGTIA